MSNLKFPIKNKRALIEALISLAFLSLLMCLVVVKAKLYMFSTWKNLYFIEIVFFGGLVSVFVFVILSCLYGFRHICSSISEDGVRTFLPYSKYAFYKWTDLDAYETSLFFLDEKHDLNNLNNFFCFLKFKMKDGNEIAFVSKNKEAVLSLHAFIIEKIKSFSDLKEFTDRAIFILTKQHYKDILMTKIFIFLVWALFLFGIVFAFREVFEFLKSIEVFNLVQKGPLPTMNIVIGRVMTSVMCISSILLLIPLKRSIRSRQDELHKTIKKIRITFLGIS